MEFLHYKLAKKRFKKTRCYRLIPSHFPPIHLFEDVADAEEFDALYTIQMLTNPRIQDEIGQIQLIPKEERLYAVPGCGYVMAAFTHINPNGSRFSSGDYGVYYASDSIPTAIAETIYHKERFLSYTNEPSQELDMRCLVADFSAELCDLTNVDKNSDPIYFPSDYQLSQRLGAYIKMAREDGLLYFSVRAKGNNYALFKPNSVHQCQQGAHYSYVWNGSRIEAVYEKKIERIES